MNFFERHRVPFSDGETQDASDVSGYFKRAATRLAIHGCLQRAHSRCLAAAALASTIELRAGGIEWATGRGRTCPNSDSPAFECAVAQTLGSGTRQRQCVADSSKQRCPNDCAPNHTQCGDQLGELQCRTKRSSQFHPTLGEFKSLESHLGQQPESNIWAHQVQRPTIFEQPQWVLFLPYCQCGCGRPQCHHLKPVG